MNEMQNERERIRESERKRERRRMLADTRTMLAWCCRVRFLVMAGAQCLLSGNHTNVCADASHNGQLQLSTSISSVHSLYRCTFVSVEDEPKIFLYRRSFLINSRLLTRKYVKNNIDFFHLTLEKQHKINSKRIRWEGAKIGKLYLIVIASTIFF